MEDTLERVRNLSDVEIVQVARTLFTDLFANIAYDQVRSTARDLADLDPLVALTPDALQRELSAADSAELGRLVVEHCAQSPELEPAVREACDKVSSSDDMVVGVLLAVGLVVNLTLLVATTEVSIEQGGDGKRSWKVKKRTAPPSWIKAIINPIARVATTQRSSLGT